MVSMLTTGRTLLQRILNHDKTDTRMHGGDYEGVGMIN